MNQLTTVGKRLAALFVSTAIPNIVAGTVMDVDVWKAAVMAGVISVAGVVKSLADSYRDGKLTAAEIDQAFDS